MRKLKECKNFGELYAAIGEENFSDIAKLLIMVMIAAPLFWGIINFGMLLDEMSYDAYAYNDKCMSVMFVIFPIITLWSILYYFGKIQFYKISIKTIITSLKEKNVWLIPWFVLLFWAILPVLGSANILGAITGTSILSSGYVTHIFMFGIMGCAAMIEESDRKDVFKSFVIISDILAIIMISYEYSVPFVSRFSAYGGLSVYTNQNHYGYFIVMATLTACGLYYESAKAGENIKKQIMPVFSFGLNVYVLMINDTLGAYLAIVLGYIFFTIIFKCNGGKLGYKYLIPGIIIAVITTMSAAGMIKPSKTWEMGTTIGQSLVGLWKDILKIKHKTSDSRNAGSLRWGIWLDALKMILERPILGYGPDVLYNKMDIKLSDTPHNEYIECAFYLGIPGLILYLGGLFTLLVDKCKKLKLLRMPMILAAGAAIGYLISAFVGVRKFNTVCYFFRFMGLLIEKDDNLKKN